MTDWMPPECVTLVRWVDEDTGSEHVELDTCFIPTVADPASDVVVYVPRAQQDAAYDALREIEALMRSGSDTSILDGIAGILSNGPLDTAPGGPREDECWRLREEVERLTRERDEARTSRTTGPAASLVRRKGRATCSTPGWRRHGSVSMRPDDITDEEIDAYGQEHAQPIDALAAMNALRDRRVRSVVIGEIAQAVETMPGVCEFDAENVAGRVRAMNDTGDHT